MEKVPETVRVVMVCGVSGSGKTTFARTLEAQGFQRLSVDVIMWERHGLAGHDYPEEMYGQYLAEAETELQFRLGELIAAGRRAVLDFSFCKRERRDFYRDFAASHGAEVLLVYCEAPLDTLKERLRRRNLVPGPDSAIVTEEMVERFYRGFQCPGDDEPHITLR